MNVAARFAVVTAASVVFTASRADADEPIPSIQQAAPLNATNLTNADLPLTNRALAMIAKVRGVDPAQIKIRSGNHAGGAFEIDIANAKDAAREARELSREFGAAATVILEHVSDDGITRTNWSFKNGTVRQVTAPVGSTGLGPRARRMYVWPEPAPKPPAAPGKLRVRQQLD